MDNEAHGISGIVPSIQLRHLPYNASFQHIIENIVSVRKPTAIRIEGPADVAQARVLFDGIIIGCKKVNGKITPTLEDARELHIAGADYIATGAFAYDDVDSANELAVSGYNLIADVSDCTSARLAHEMGVKYLSTTLSGYIGKCSHPFSPPDIDLVKKCSKLLPTIAEGRYWTPKQISKAKEAGACAVCIGKAITDVGLISEHFQVCWDGDYKKYRGEK